MRCLSVRNADSLYWVGRYLQRFEILAKESIKSFDSVIDIDFNDAKRLFSKIGYNISYDSSNNFLNYVTKDLECGSLLCCITSARENAIVLRDLIDDEAFRGINLIHSELKSLNKIDVKHLERLVRELDRFWGYVFIKTTRSKSQAFIEFGQVVEAIDLKLRLFRDISTVLYDIDKLNTLGKSIDENFSHIEVHGDMPIDDLLNIINSKVTQIIKYDS